MLQIDALLVDEFCILSVNFDFARDCRSWCGACASVGRGLLHFDPLTSTLDLVFSLTSLPARLPH